ncbi:uncharacterized protein LOC123008949 [Tribolium madens]|uniref:uncharacterized protein LOC123008949 n=1 Tax=Tribolium madens TaxID=41895 RepID=UPI001CF72ABE|nr:uncharacterized protein LOC123008949 [Tribolium madens]
MDLIVLLCAFFALGVFCAPMDDTNDVTIDEEDFQNDTQPAPNLKTLEDKPETNEKNPVQEWFENLGKNMSTNTQNTMTNIKNWFTQLAQNNNGGQNLPTMYMGSFQLLKMPMPQFSDVIKGMGDVATVVQSLNKLGGKK